MKRDMKYLIVLFTIFIVGAFVAGCSELNVGNDDFYDEMSSNSNCKSIPDTVNLCYYKDTKIVYVIFDTQYKGFFAPYYSENGKLCRYIDGEIVEID